MPALGMQATLLAMLLVLWGLGWGGSCLVWGWAWMMETMRWPAGVRMALVVGRSQELLQAALGIRFLTSHIGGEEAGRRPAPPLPEYTCAQAAPSTRPEANKEAARRNLLGGHSEN